MRGLLDNVTVRFADEELIPEEPVDVISMRDVMLFLAQEKAEEA